MSNTIEATGRTLDEAKRAAADQLGVSVDDCEFEVLEQGSKGLFAKSNFKVKAIAKKVTKAAVEAEVIEEKETAEEKPAKPARESRTPKKKPEVVASSDSEVSTDAPPVEIEATDEDAAVALEMVQGIFDAAGMKVKAEVQSVGGKYVNLSLNGADVSALVDARNPILDSLQYLSNAMLTRTLPKSVRLTLDAKEYRAQRTEQLEKLAREVAAEVVKRKQEAVLDALPAHERRIVHHVLTGIEGIETYSEGEEPNRRVVITPKQ